ncbi:HAD superfamily hydrolase [Enterococcus sp. 10A9_DIV0425]|uniref:HAD superfamily hydrolase n=1 Tax=Candidatus Enterococcus wittei TaxID=1987383 RepID=A0A2C9XR61_9ENTE|nr:Cof-type HAD-IIB family hydrolase [Enterococcus sp. 10A9_DIV0425]OTP11906.1 HAD superfamily hydrolase [Enterococcus sp. 10A9_DIV0425]THE15965.1 Cof-type HAD-IIB family hydrolase [Enterococcus hirae]
MKLAAIDLDGTLLDSQGLVPKANIEALQTFYSNGGIVTIATGRNSISAKDIFEQLSIGGYLISSNGSFIAKMQSGEIVDVLRRSKIELPTLKRAFFLAKEAKISIIASRETQDDQLTFDEDNLVKDDPYYAHFNLQNHSFEEITEQLNDPSLSYLKLALTDKNEEKLHHIQQELKKDGIDSVFSDPHFLEITPKNITKAHSLLFLTEHLGITADDVMAFGDQENDIAMLNCSGLSVAMGNAQERVKTLADQVTKTNDEAGVAYFLKTYFE